MTRRGFLATAGRLALILPAAHLAMGHTPFRQWVVFRRRHLLVLAERTDPLSYPLAVAVAKTLAEHLPESSARPSRASNMRRVASLIGTGQMEVAVLTRENTAQLMAGAMGEHAPIALRTLFEFDKHLLVSREDFPDAHAYLVAATLDRNRATLPVPGARLPAATAVPPHPGVVAYVEGRPPPDMPVGEDAAAQDEDHDHKH